MPNTNFQTFHQMGNAINDVVRQATGRDNVQNIDMDFVTVAQRTRWIEHIVSGDVVTFETNMVSPLNYLITNLSPVQSLHGYDNSWIGGAGKNLLKLESSYEDRYGVSFTPDPSSGSVVVNGTSNNQNGSNRSLKTIPVTEGSNIFVSGTPADGGSENYCIRVVFRDVAGGTNVQYEGASATDIPSNGLVMTVPTGATVIDVYARVVYNAQASNVVMLPMVANSNTAIAFEPYANICPITGWDAVQIERTGENLFNPNSESTTWVNSNNQITSRPTCKSVTIMAKEGQTFTLSNKNYLSSSNIPMIAFCDANDNVLQRYATSSSSLKGITQTAPANTAYMIAGMYTWADADEVQLELADEASSYTPYVDEKKYSISLPQTTYRGTLTVNKDGSGTLTIDKILIEVDGTEYFSDVTANNMFFIQSDAYEELSDTSQATDLCNMFVIAGEELQDEMINHEAESKNIYIKSSVFSGYTGEQLATYFASNNLQLTCDLIESETITLTAEQINTLVGENNIWTDTDNVTVSYNVKREVI